MLQLLTLLRERPKGVVNIEIPQGDHESYRFATQLASILQAAGWKVENISKVVYLGEQPVGIELAAHSKDSIPSDAHTLKEVFDLFGFTPTWMILTGMPKGTFDLRVGHKPKYIPSPPPRNFSAGRLAGLPGPDLPTTTGELRTDDQQSTPSRQRLAFTPPPQAGPRLRPASGATIGRCGSASVACQS